MFCFSLRIRCAEDGGERWHVGKARVVNRVEMEPDTEVSFTMPMILPKFYYAITSRNLIEFRACS